MYFFIQSKYKLSETFNEKTESSSHGSLHFPVEFLLFLVTDFVLLRCGLEDPGSDHVGPEHQEASQGSQQ